MTKKDPDKYKEHGYHSKSEMRRNEITDQSPELPKVLAEKLETHAEKAFEKHGGFSYEVYKESAEWFWKELGPVVEAAKTAVKESIWAEEFCAMEYLKQELQTAGLVDPNPTKPEEGS